MNKTKIINLGNNNQIDLQHLLFTKESIKLHQIILE